MTQTPSLHEGAPRYVIGVDVGTGSARAGLFDMDGHMLAVAKRDITLFREAGSIVEQSSTEIWNSVCAIIREAVASARIDPAQVVGLGFDATCSLVVLAEGGQPLAVGPSEENERDIIVWMDHRAVDQAERINAKGHEVLRYVGGRISPEMETPKILWLKENRPASFAGAWQFFDLADFLTWKSTGDLSRSTCTVTCKWTYLAHEARWDESYFDEIGLGELAAEGFARIGTEIVEPGTRLGAGLTNEAAHAMGLKPGTAVAAGMIDAHAGGIGTVGIGGNPTENLAYVFGTSSCTMTSTVEPVFVPGVWGPYYSAMVPGMWLNEGGQSAAGAAIDQLLSFHPAASEATAKARSERKSLPAYMAEAAAEKVSMASEAVELAAGLHVVPEFLGNRAPFADPHARAVIAGLGMERDFDSLVALYIAGLCGIGYGLRQIIETQAKSGASIERVVISGGAGASPLVRQILADACGKPVVAPDADEPVLLGSAILGSVAAGIYPDVRHAMEAFSKTAAVYTPDGQDVAAIHERRYQAFLNLQEVSRAIRSF
ncbi:MAG: FGGY-family carbohydrate kinase [Rhizobium sp.]|nr:FGGY-family carbohydrate kinase [Rhizobium sp.]